MIRHLRRYIVLAFTYAAGRGLLFLALLLPSLHGADAESLGRLEMLLVAAALGAALGPLGTDHALLHADHSGRRRRWHRASITALMGGAILGVAITMAQAHAPWGIAAALGAALAWNKVAQAHLRVHDTLTPLLCSSLLLLAGFCAGFYAVQSLGRSPIQASTVGLIVGASLSVLPSWGTQRSQPPGGEGGWRRMIAFGLPLSAATLAAWVVATADRFMLGMLVGMEAVGIYALVVRTVMLYSGLCSTVVLWWQIETLRRGDTWTRKHALRFLLAAASGVSLGALLLGHPLIRWLPSVLPEMPPDLQSLVTWRLIGVVAFTLGALCLAPLVVARKVHTVASVWCANAILNIVLNFLLIPRHGMVGAAEATCLSNLAALFLAYFALRMHFTSSEQFDADG